MAGTTNPWNNQIAQSNSSITLNTLTVDTTGRMTNASQPAFFAYNTTLPTNVTGDGTTVQMIYDTELYDIGSNFASNTFTAPKTGIYLFAANILAQNCIAASQPTIALMITGQTYNASNNAGSFVGNNTWTNTWVVQMTAGNTAIINFSVSGGTKTVGYYGAAGDPRTYFCGYLVA